MRAIDRVTGAAGSKSIKVGSSHLFLAILDEPDDAVGRLFAQLELGLDDAREEIAESLR